jgi:hypothetical protein
MINPTQLALIHAEIDDELDDRQRAELSRALLADPALRASRDEMRRMCRALDAIPEVEPPAQLRDDIFAALPQIQASRAGGTWAESKWRYAAVLAGVLLTGAVAFRVIDFGQEAAVGEMSGTLAAPRAAVTVDMVQISAGDISGRANLVREGAELALTLELAPHGPVDVLVESGARSVRVNNLVMAGNHGLTATKIPLPGFGNGRGTIRLRFLREGRPIGQAALGVSAGH